MVEREEARRAFNELTRTINKLCNVVESVDERKEIQENVDTVKNYLMYSGTHICKYCGAEVEGENPDELCVNCHMLFGHSLFSEL